jgi:hypothetical protein
MLQVERSWGRFPITSLNFSSLNMALGFTQSLIEISTRNLSAG